MGVQYKLTAIKLFTAKFKGIFKIINPLHYTKGSLTYNLKKGTNKIDLAKKGHENN